MISNLETGLATAVETTAPSMTLTRILVRYHEIALKGDNRKWFENCLAENSRKMLKRAQPLAPVKIQKQFGRILIETEWSPAAREALKKVFGISSFSPAKPVLTDMDSISQGCVDEVLQYRSLYGHLPRTFCVRTKRSEKALCMISVDIDREIGRRVLAEFPELKVDLENPELTLGVEVRFENSYIWSEKFRCHGGLPTGSNASVLSLISGGLDSPVAAIQTLRRGSPTSFVHFYGTPFVGEEALEKVRDLVRIVNQFQPTPRPLYVVPFGGIQEKIALATDPRMRTILYRRMMIRISEKIAERIGAKALITGERLGQVASQTLENMATINSVARLPILRPLITFTKEDIIDQAHKWGSFDVSVRPAADCCTLFADRHPILRSSIEAVEKQESQFSPQALIQEALDQIQICDPT